jgi:hypothetical protein
VEPAAGEDPAAGQNPAASMEPSAGEDPAAGVEPAAGGDLAAGMARSLAYYSTRPCTLSNVTMTDRISSWKTPQFSSMH